MRFGSARLAGLALLVVAGIAMWGCDSLPADQSLRQRLESIPQDGQRVSLRDLTDFSWDTLYVYGGYMKGAWINDQVGGYVMAPLRYTDENEQLLVFDLGGRPVDQVSMYSWGDQNQRKWPADVQVVATPNCPVLLVLPTDPDPPARCLETLP